MSWVISRTPTFSADICLRWFRVSSTDFSSSPGVGSSAITSFGFERRAVDTRTLLAIPPDNWKGYMSSTSSDRLYFSKIALCLALFSFSSSSSTHSPITWSDTFINGSRKFTDCGINAISSPRNFCFNSSVRTSPLYIMVPERFAF